MRPVQFCGTLLLGTLLCVTGALAETAGVTAPGSTSYPNAGFQRVDSLATARQNPLTALHVDEANQVGYLITSGSPFRMVKVDLNTLAILDGLSIKDHFSLDGQAVWDAADGFAYVGAGWNPGEILKIDLTNMRLAGVLTLNLDDLYPGPGWIDPQGRYAYFEAQPVWPGPAKIVKIDLDNFTRVGEVNFLTAESDVRCAVITPDGHYGYFGTYTNQGYIVKVDLQTMTRVSAVSNSGDSRVVSAVIDPAGNFAYFGTYTAPGRVVKYDLSTFTKVGESLQMNNGLLEHNLIAAMMDPAGTYAYFGNFWTNPTRIIKVDLGTFTRAAANDMAIGQIFTEGYVGASGTQAWMIRGGLMDFDLSTLSATRTMTFPEFEGGSSYLGFVDGALDRAFLVGDSSIVPINTATFGLEPTIDFASGDGSHGCVVLDPLNHIAYAGTSTRIVKFDLNAGTRVGGLTLGSGSFQAGVIDPANSVAYFAGMNESVRIEKVDLSTFSGTETATLWDVGETISAAIDTANQVAYFGTSQSPARVYKFDLATMTKVDQLTLDSGENYAPSMVFDPATNSLLVGVDTTPGKVVRIDTTTFTRTGAVTPSTDHMGMFRGALDPITGKAVFIAEGWVGEGNGTFMFQVDPATLAVVGTLPLQERGFALALDPQEGFIYTGSPDYPTWSAKVAYGHAGILRATKLTLSESADITDMRFYSHAAAGNLRLSLYDNSVPRNLLWSSGVVANSVAGGEVVVPVGSGTPSTLQLPAGTYWLGWQTDSQAAVPSYAAGTLGDSFNYPMPFGADPSIIYPVETIGSDAIWTQYITYNEIPDVTAPSSVAAADSDTQIGGNITGTYVAQDDALGTGVASVALHVRQQGFAWSSAGAVTGGTWSYTPTGGAGVYYFQTLAADNATNSETAPTGSTGTGDDSVVYSTSSNSPVTQDVAAGSASYIFPMEPGVDVTITFEGVTSPGTVLVDRSESDSAPTGYASIGIANQFWTITAGGGLSFGSATIVLVYDESALGMDENLLNVVYRDAAGTVTTPSFTIDTVANTITITDVTGFSDWYIGNLSGLPVELDSVHVE